MYVYNTPTLQGKSLNVHENFSSKHLAINLILRRFIALTIFHDNHTYININTKLSSIQMSISFSNVKAFYIDLYS